MDRTKAKQIISDLVNFFFTSEVDNQNHLDINVLRRIESYTLLEMIQASDILEKQPSEEYIADDGKKYRRHIVNIDDRLIIKKHW